MFKKPPYFVHYFLFLTKQADCGWDVTKCREINCMENSHLNESRRQIKYANEISGAHFSQLNEAEGAHRVIITSQFNT